MTTAPRKYQASYNNYINGDCDDKARRELLDLLRSGKRSAGELGKSNRSGKQYSTIKSKSQSCLAGAVISGRSATANLYKRNQETGLIRPSSTKMTTANEAYSQFTKKVNSRV